MKVQGYCGCDHGSPVYILGWQFGPCLVTVHAELGDAIDEFDERFGTRVESDDPALADYPGATIAERIDSAMNAGDIRVNGGGTMVWVDPYEWMRECTRAEAREYFRNMRY